MLQAVLSTTNAWRTRAVVLQGPADFIRVQVLELSILEKGRARNFLLPVHPIDRAWQEWCAARGDLRRNVQGLNFMSCPDCSVRSVEASRSRDEWLIVAVWSLRKRLALRCEC